MLIHSPLKIKAYKSIKSTCMLQKTGYHFTKNLLLNSAANTAIQQQIQI